MRQRFNAGELFALRNDIPIRWLIESKLRIACKNSEGIFRFQCPCCSGFHTATNCTTNLARCFHCRRSFNPIDLVIVSKRLGFVESVVFLQRCCLEEGLDKQTVASPEPRLPSEPLAAGEILRRIVLSQTKNIPEKIC
jgi:hypothetical protein